MKGPKYFLDINLPPLGKVTFDFALVGSPETGLIGLVSFPKKKRRNKKRKKARP